MVTHSNILAWKIPWTEEPDGLQSVGLQSHTQLSDFHFHTYTHTHIYICMYVYVTSLVAQMLKGLSTMRET